MATNEITPPTNQRPNYFAGQYLLEDDFQLQQQYHRDRQRWHHHLLHVSGIAEGLKVTKGEGDLAVNVSEGSAIDPQGQQITLLAPQKVDLTKALDSSNSATPNGSYTLYIGYSEQKTDQQTAGNEITSRRWQEEPKFQLSSAELTDFIPLAKLTINSNVVSDNIDNSIRVYSGLRLPTLDGGIALCSKNDGTTSLAELKGSLSIAGTLSVTDNVGIGMPANSVAKLQVQIDGQTTATSLKLEHNGSNFIVRPVSAGGTSSIIENTGAGSLIINPAGGNVGIGTSSPTEKLTVNGNLSVTDSITAGSLSVGNGTLDFGQTTRQMLNLWKQSYGVGVQSGTTYFRTDKNFAWYKSGSHNDAELNAGSGGTVHMVINDGNVGIGTTSPTEKLTVKGNIKLDKDSTISSPGRMHISGEESLYLLNKNGVTIGKEWGGNGNLFVQGTLSATAKSFMIDHPLDPENKYLIHACLEGPENVVFYRGEAHLNNGQVTVILPEYFEALTRKEKRTVMVTPKIEGEAPVSGLAASDVKNGAFIVKQIDDKNHSQKFYWEIKAIRSDIEELKVEEVKALAATK